MFWNIKTCFLIPPPFFLAEIFTVGCTLSLSALVNISAYKKGVNNIFSSTSVIYENAEMLSYKAEEGISLLLKDLNTALFHSSLQSCWCCQLFCQSKARSKSD